MIGVNDGNEIHRLRRFSQIKNLACAIKQICGNLRNLWMIRTTNFPRGGRDQLVGLCPPATFANFPLLAAFLT